jgi:sugar/nucleoside kinase (ribokinase family)
VSILVVGSVGLDTITTPHGKVEDILGGSAAHFSISASFYTDVRLVAVVGSDFPGDNVEALKRRGVCTKGLQVRDGATFRWSGYYTVDYHKAYTLETHLNVFKDFQPALPADYRDSEFVFLANIDPELQMQVLSQMKAPKLVIGDTMNFWIETKRDQVLEVLKKIDLLLVNDGEARELCETHNMIEAGRMLLTMGPKQVIIKKGEHGAALFHDDKVFIAPAYPYARLVDPTGAGDSFAGGLVGHLARSGDLAPANLRRAVVYGSIMGSFNVEDFGPGRLKRLEDGEIDRRFKEFEEIGKF